MLTGELSCPCDRSCIDIWGHFVDEKHLFSSPGLSPGRAVVLPLAFASALALASAAVAALAKSLTLNFFM